MNDMERHLQTVIAGVAVLILGWIGVTTYSTSVTVARIDERLAYTVLAIQVNSDAIADHEDRLRELERQ